MNNNVGINDGSNNNNKNIDDTSEEWRSMKARTKKVREISQILSNVDGKKSAAETMMLALKFEDQIFKASKTLNEYDVTLNKRLKRLKKHYKPAPETKENNIVVTSTHVQNGRSVTTIKTVEEERLEKELCEVYGDKLMYIIENASEALPKMRLKLGTKGEKMLKQHVDNVCQWAIEINLLPTDYIFYGNEMRVKSKDRTLGYLHKIKGFMAKTVDKILENMMKLVSPDLYLEEELVKVEKDLNEKVLGELVSALPPSSSSSTTTTATTTTAAATEDDVQILNIKASSSSANNSENSTLESLIEKATVPIPVLREDEENKEENVKRIKQMHLSKLKAATDAIFMYVTNNNSETKRFRDARAAAAAASTSASSVVSSSGTSNGGVMISNKNNNVGDDRLKNIKVLKRMHEIAIQSCLFLEEKKQLDVQQLDRNGNSSSAASVSDNPEQMISPSEVLMKDVWNKMIRYKQPPQVTNKRRKMSTENDTDDTTTSNNTTKNNMNNNTTNNHIVTKTRVIPWKMSRNLLYAIREKNAIVIRSGNDNTTTRIKMTFGKATNDENKNNQSNTTSNNEEETNTNNNNNNNAITDGAFEVVIYFCPLYVTFQPVHTTTTNKDNNSEASNINQQQQHPNSSSSLSSPTRSYSSIRSPSKSPLKSITQDHDVLPSWSLPSHFTRKAYYHHHYNILLETAKGTTTSTNNNKTTATTPLPPEFILSKKLELASANATHVLRKCFSDLVPYSSTDCSDFEIEMSEASALILFMQTIEETFLGGEKNDENNSMMSSQNNNNNGNDDGTNGQHTTVANH